MEKNLDVSKLLTRSKSFARLLFSESITTNRVLSLSLSLSPLRSFESEKCELCVNCFITKTEELLRNVGHFKTLRS